jgi:dTDP-4-dehydrorhamnose reductase
MRLLVLGGWGQLGSDLALAAAGRHELVRPRHADLDVTDAEALYRFVAEQRPDAVVNAAAFHKVELCEEDPQRAFSVNALGALHVARAARAAGSRTVFISTDYVFDGRSRSGFEEDDPVGPLNVYGVSKAAGELAVRQADPDSLVVRGSGLFGHAGSAGKGGNFVDNMIARARSGQALSIVDDQIFAPTATRDMAERILLLLERRPPPGIYHAANGGSCSWYELARTAIEMEGLKAEVSPRPTGETPVHRPACSVLLDTKSVRVGLPPSRSWEEALRWYLRNRPSAAPSPTGEAASPPAR